MPRFRLNDESSHAIWTDNSSQDQLPALRKESGDAQVWPKNKPESLKGVTEQKKEFTKYIRSQKPKPVAGDEKKQKRQRRKSSGLSSGELENVTIDSDLKVCLDIEENWSDELSSCQIVENEEFYKILHSKAPNHQETTSLLDQVTDLQSHLKDWVARLREVGEEIRKVKKAMTYDPFDSKTKIENEVTMAKVMSSVQLMQNLCAEMDKHFSETDL